MFFQCQDIHRWMGLRVTSLEACLCRKKLVSSGLGVPLALNPEVIKCNPSSFEYPCLFYTNPREGGGGGGVPAKVIDLLDFSIRKVTSVAGFFDYFVFQRQLFFNICHQAPPTVDSGNRSSLVAAWGKGAEPRLATPAAAGRVD